MSVIWNEAFKQIKVLSLPEDKTIYGLFVEGGTKIPEVNVVYNDALSASLVGGDTATLPVASKKMKTDIKIAVPESAFSNIPTEVSTEAEMTALLESGEVGGVYKYTGTTGTYENGALYVLENATITFTIDGTSYEAEDGMTWEQWVASDCNTDDYVANGNSIYNDTGLLKFVKETHAHSVLTTDTIISNHAYFTSYSGGVD